MRYSRKTPIMDFTLLSNFLLAFLLLSSTMTAAQETQTHASGGHHIPFIEQVLLQPFTLSVISEKYGVFNATLVSSGSLNFPERIHAEVIPLGAQRGAQVALEHFNIPRGAAGLLPPPTATARDPHPSLMMFEVQMKYSGAAAGVVVGWSLPGVGGGRPAAPPSARASFEFQREPRHTSLAALSDIAATARTATGELMWTDGHSGSFTMRFISDHEFTLNLLLHSSEKTGEVEADHIWVHGYAPPSDTVLYRGIGQPVPWWHTWGLYGLAVLVFGMQILTAMVDSKRANKQRLEQIAATSAAAGDSKKIK